MSRNQGRPRKNNVLVSFNMPATTLSTLKSERPNLLKPNSTEFRHGALGSYLESLIWKDLRGAKYEAKGKVISDGLAGGQQESPTDSGTISGRTLHQGGIIESRDEFAEGGISSAGGSSQSTSIEKRSGPGSIDIENHPWRR